MPSVPKPLLESGSRSQMRNFLLLSTVTSENYIKTTVNYSVQYKKNLNGIYYKNVLLLQEFKNVFE
jgi:hypothetical protein